MNTVTGPEAIAHANKMETEACKHVGFGPSSLGILPASILTAKQVKTYGWRTFSEKGVRYKIFVTVRYDDQCGNGHNSFAITADIKRLNRTRWVDDSCGCCHKEVARVFPALAPLLKWHLCSSDGPMHYVANTLYHVKQEKLDYARSTAVWPEITDQELIALSKNEGLEGALLDRLPVLMREFKAAVESLGLVY